MEQENVFDCDGQYDDESLYGQHIPALHEYTKEPALLPPHMRHIILNQHLSSRNVEHGGSRLAQRNKKHGGMKTLMKQILEVKTIDIPLLRYSQSGFTGY